MFIVFGTLVFTVLWFGLEVHVSGKSQEGSGIEVLRRLRDLRVDLPYYHNRAGVNVQPELYYSGANAGLCL